MLLDIPRQITIHYPRTTHVRWIFDAPDLVPVTVDDIKSLPEIIQSPDSVKPTVDGQHRGLLYTKRVNGTIVVVQVLATRLEKLRFKTMRKHKAK